MKNNAKKIISLVLCFVFVFSLLPLNAAAESTGFTEKTTLSAELAEYIKSAFYAAKTQAGIEGTFLGSDKYTSGASSTGTDWLALAMGRFGKVNGDGTVLHLVDDGTGYDDYLSAMKTYIEKTYTKNNGLLHRVKATEWHRAAVTVSALGGNSEKFGIYNGNDIDLIADGSYNCVISAGPGKQGINGWIWGLISLDAQRTEVPENAKYTRERMITELLQMQYADGGWALFGNSSDVDITAMVIQALAPYCTDETEYTYENRKTGETVTKTVKKCVEEALDKLGSMMNENGGFASWGSENAESISQVIVALTAVGIDPAADSRFISSTGKTPLDGLLQFRLPSGGFSHTLSSDFNSMANDQATYALVSYWRFENGLRSLYDMVPEMTEEENAKVEAAEKAINEIPDRDAENFKKKTAEALKAYEEVADGDRRYIRGHNLLASYIDLAGGKEEIKKAEEALEAKKELENAKNEALEELKKYGNVSERLLAAAREEIAAATTKEDVAAALEKVRNAVPATPETKPEVKPENPGTADTILPLTATIAILSLSAMSLLIKKKKEI